MTSSFLVFYLTLFLYPPSSSCEVGNLNGRAAVACRSVGKLYKAAPKNSIIYVHIKWKSVAQAMYKIGRAHV